MDGVLVVGAGPVGLTAACQLARLGITVRVVDALATPTTESRAVGVHARSLEMLAALGVLPALEARGRRIGVLAMTDGRSGDTRARIPVGDIASRHPYVLDIPQPDTEAVLADRAAELGVAVERGTRLTALAQDGEGVTVTLAGPEGERTEQVGWVVGADGGHSTTRHLLGTHLEGAFHGQHFAMADVDVDTSLTRDTIWMFTHPEGMGIHFPLAGDRARVMFLVEEPTADAPTLAEIQSLADARMGGRLRVRDPRWLAYFEVHHAQVPQYRHGRVLLAGDAAHIHSPAGAQGMNTGMQDAANLAWKLALVVHGRADARLLDSYHDERHPVGAAVVRKTTLLTDVGTASGPAGTIRDVALFLVGHVRRVSDAAATQMAELTIGYRDSALSVRHGRHHGDVRAGDHAPDPDGLQRPDGTPVTIEELQATPGFLLLVHGGPGALATTLGDLGTVVAIGRDVLDPEGALARAYGNRDGMVLVRPDGYVGLVADTTDPHVLRRYLADTLGVAVPAVA
ncbi:FAD-dependent monooxygenase [Actinomycetospora straminea]|uniref:FAD-dependent monooxygenase n=1 Tax=Actinomycetospora straminea TaxID=663607 RepID=A0ABP9EAJ2_9PSEU|nr:FAD-dependent monooxygenase [Actinomycetospora straminea]MDD7932750.1 FAD-dependent monooxygenase [Actinomycetospora straminea]